MRRRALLVAVVLLASVASILVSTHGIVAEPLILRPIPGPTQELFGHITLVQGYALPNFQGCHALVALRDSPGKTIAVLTTDMRLQMLLQTALATGNLVAIHAQKLTNPPSPMGGTWAVDVYGITSVIVYGSK